MDSIAVTKPNMAVLSQKRLFISPFGALAQAFAQELLAQAEQRQGAYPYVPLELLREGEEEAHPQWPAPVLQVDLHLILQALREQKGTAEQIKSTQRIVERIIEREKQVKQRPARADHSSSERHEPPHQAFYQIVNQNIHLTMTRQVESGGEKGAASLHTAVPGQLGWQAAAFSRQLQTLAQQERPFGMRQAKERPHLGFLPLERQGERYLPTEVMTHLGAGVGRAEMEESGERSRLNRKLTRAAEQVLDQVLTRTEEPGRAVRQRYDQRQVSEAVRFPADEARNAHQREDAAPAPSGVSGDTRPEVDQAGYREASSGKKGRPSTPRPTEGRGEMGAQPHTSTVAGRGTKRKDIQTMARKIRTGPVASIETESQPGEELRPVQGVAQGAGAPPQLTYLAPEGAAPPAEESQPPVPQAQRQEREPQSKEGRFPAVGEEKAPRQKEIQTTAREIRKGPAVSLSADTQPEAGTRPTQGMPQGVGVPSQLTYLAPEGAVSPEGESRPPVSQAQRREREPQSKGSRFPAAGEEQASKRKEIQITAREIRTGPAASMAADTQPEAGTRPTQGVPQGVGIPSQLTYLAPEGAVFPEGESQPPVPQAQRREREPQSKGSRFPAAGEEQASKRKEIQTTAREIRTGPAVSLSADTQPEAGTRPTQGVPQGVGVPSQLTYLAPEGAVSPEGESHPPVSQVQRQEREPQSKEGRFPAVGEEKAPRQKEIQTTAREIRTGLAVSLLADTQPEAGTRPTEGMPQGVGIPSQLTYLAPEGAVSPEGESHPPVSQAQRQEREPGPKGSQFPAAGEEKAPRQKEIQTTAREIRTGPAASMAADTQPEAGTRPTEGMPQGVGVPSQLTYLAPEGAVFPEGESHPPVSQAQRREREPGPKGSQFPAAGEEKAPRQKEIQTTAREIRTGPAASMAADTQPEAGTRPTQGMPQGVGVPSQLTYLAPEGAVFPEGESHPPVPQAQRQEREPQSKEGRFPAAGEEQASKRKEIQTTAREIRTGPAVSLSADTQPEAGTRPTQGMPQGVGVPSQLTYLAPEGAAPPAEESQPPVSQAQRQEREPQSKEGRFPAAGEEQASKRKEIQTTAREIRTGPAVSMAADTQPEGGTRPTQGMPQGVGVPSQLTYLAPEGAVSPEGESHPPVSQAQRQEREPQSKESWFPAVGEEKAPRQKEIQITAREIRTGPAVSMAADTQPEAGTRPTQGVPQGVGIPSQLTYLAPEGAVSPEGESRPPVPQAQRQEREPQSKGSRFPAAGEEQASKRKEIQTTAREIRTGPAASLLADTQPEAGTRPTQGVPQGVGVPSQLTYLAPVGEKEFQGGLSHTHLSAQLGRAAYSGGIWAGWTHGQTAQVRGLHLGKVGLSNGQGSQKDTEQGEKRESRATAQRSGPGPVELTYSQAQKDALPSQSEAGRPQPAMESEYVRSLPDWAQKFLRESSGQSLAEREMVVAQKIASLPPQEEQVQWTAPNYRPPATIAYREKAEKTLPRSQPEPGISDAELQRTADRVYRMIEDRIRRERRRLGF